MSSKGHRQARFTAAGWFSLAYLYSGLCWLAAVPLLLGQVGWLGAAAALGRMGTTVWFGVGLCAQERWAWAAAMCQCALYAGLALVAALAGAIALATQPAGVLSWQPVFLGLSSGAVRTATTAGGLVATGAALSLVLLWRHRQEYDVERRRAFTALWELGAAPALLSSLADVALLLGWWTLHQAL